MSDWHGSLSWANHQRRLGRAVDQAADAAVADFLDEQLTCLDAHNDPRGCAGQVQLRESMSGTGTLIPRCDAHQDAALDRHAAHLQIYPDSSTPPDWFDPSAAGEHWDSDY